MILLAACFLFCVVAVTLTLTKRPMKPHLIRPTKPSLEEQRKRVRLRIRDLQAQINSLSAEECKLTEAINQGEK